jgi:DNA polymerase-3 subunit delta
MKKPSSITVFAGTDDAAVSRAAKEFVTLHTPKDAGEFGLETIDGAAENADRATQAIHQTIEALLTVPFFGGAKLVWLKDATFFADSVTGRAAAVVEGLEKLGSVLEQGLPPEVRLLISSGPMDKRRTLYKWLAKNGDVTIFDRPDASKSGWEESAMSIVEECAALHGLTIETRAAQLLLARCGPDTRLLESEIEKLALYLGKEARPIKVEDVRLMVPLTKAGVIWELGNAIAERDLRTALAHLERLLRQGENAVGILLVAIIPTVRNLLIARDLMLRYRLRPPAQPFHFTRTLQGLPQDAIKHLPKKKDGGVNTYALGIAAMTAERFEIPELVAAMEACLDANVQLVTSQLEPRIVLSNLITRILGGARTAPRVATRR